MSRSSSGEPQPTYARLVPELVVSDAVRSLDFWRNFLGFRIVYERPEEGFVFLDRDGAQIMIEERRASNRQWITGALETPYGRGVNFQIEVDDLDAILKSLSQAKRPLYMAPEEKWYRAGNVEAGVRQCIVQDPDGYLVRLSMSLGRRALVK